MSLFIGLMSGTSMDAIDAVLLNVDQAPPAFVATRTVPMPEEVQSRLHAIVAVECPQAPELWRLDSQLGELFADAALALVRDTGLRPSDISAIGSHGQTVFHAPAGATPYSVQIADPNIIAERTRITTVADFRRRDIAAGGQGAPLAPAFHEVMFAKSGVGRAVLNIGGIANVTVLPETAGAAVRGFDTGPGNTLLDAWTRRHRNASIDVDGAWAMTGTVVAPLLDVCLSDPYFHLAPPKSTGREHFNLAWLDKQLVAVGQPIPAADVQRTLCELTAAAATLAVTRHAPETQEVLVCGGGVHNPITMAALRTRLAPVPVRSTAALGFAPEWIEAAAFAWLAWRTLQGEPGNLPSVSGARRKVVLGGIYPKSDRER